MSVFVSAPGGLAVVVMGGFGHFLLAIFCFLWGLTCLGSVSEKCVSLLLLHMFHYPDQVVVPLVPVVCSFGLFLTCFVFAPLAVFLWC